MACVHLHKPTTEIQSSSDRILQCDRQRISRDMNMQISGRKTFLACLSQSFETLVLSTWKIAVGVYFDSLPGENKENNKFIPRYFATR